MNISDAIATFAEDDLEGRLLGYLPEGLKVTSWQPGGFFRAIMEEQWLEALANFLGPAGLRLSIVEGGYPGLNGDDWLTLAAEQLFNVERNIESDGVTQFAATRTIQTLVLSCDASHGPYPILAGAFWVRSPLTGNRYVAVSSGTLPTSGTLTIAVQSEFPQDSGAGRNYSDGEGTLTVLENVLPGVSCSNVAPDFSAVTTTPDPAAGAGVVTVSGTRAVAPTAYDVQIVASGQVGAATFQYRANGGAWQPAVPATTAASYAIPSGPTVHFTNAAGGVTPSFIAGDVYGFVSPGTPIQQQGQDPESDADLLDRCYQRWPDLTAAPPDPDKRETWAKSASSLVTRAKVIPDPTYPGRALVYIAGLVNPLSSGVVASVQAYIDPREGICDLSLVAAASVATITATGVVTVPRGQLALIQAAAATLWNKYVNADDIGGLVELSVLEQYLRDVGAVDVLGLELDGGGGPAPADVVLASNQVATPADITTSLTWEEI